ncbi:hypothetical protein SAMN06269185_0942 [Natronoarchaeum philippinense]|uniref:Uncharacterized protein n=1 Tax=Natronoarchaeum philippinense TaxID=558529 RepID=A0A285NA38_NATPI|nr:hypothetical protein [Natronoarchaeum philippinense]SNZ05763.1 hypothetical protein SAMN06269185_0942 [Natronoarchaeum philippinense]
MVNRHFHDARYYLGRTVEHATLGVVETLDPVVAKGRELAGTEDEPEPTRVDRVRTSLHDADERAVEAGRALAGDARRRVRRYRGT